MRVFDNLNENETNYPGGIVIPNEAELNLGGFYFGQVIIPKKSHVTRWSIGQLVRMSKMDLSVGPVLHLIDLWTGDEYEELPVYVDFLVARKTDEAYQVRMHQLVTPRSNEETSQWVVGSVDGFRSVPPGILNDLVVRGVCKNQNLYSVKSGDVNLLVRVESTFQSVIKKGGKL